MWVKEPRRQIRKRFIQKRGTSTRIVACVVWSQQVRWWWSRLLSSWVGCICTVQIILLDEIIYYYCRSRYICSKCEAFGMYVGHRRGLDNPPERAQRPELYPMSIPPRPLRGGAIGRLQHAWQEHPPSVRVQPEDQRTAESTRGHVSLECGPHL